MLCLHVSKYIMCMSDSHECPGMVPYALKLEFWNVVVHHVDTGNPTWKSTGALKYRGISPAGKNINFKIEEQQVPKG